MKSQEWQSIPVIPALGREVETASQSLLAGQEVSRLVSIRFTERPYFNKMGVTDTYTRQQHLVITCASTGSHLHMSRHMHILHIHKVTNIQTHIHCLSFPVHNDELVNFKKKKQTKSRLWIGRALDIIQSGMEHELSRQQACITG